MILINQISFSAVLSIRDKPQTDLSFKKTIDPETERISDQI
jgi:hypothetical protein